MFHNVVIGTPLVEADKLIASDEIDWNNFEKKNTLFTNSRFLPTIMKEAGVVSSTSEVKRNRKDLVITLDKPDCLNIKFGKKHLFIVVGE